MKEGGRQRAETQAHRRGNLRMAELPQRDRSVLFAIHVGVELFLLRIDRDYGLALGLSGFRLGIDVTSTCGEQLGPARSEIYSSIDGILPQNRVLEFCPVVGGAPVGG
jgi:hypothetical protein